MTQPDVQVINMLNGGSVYKMYALFFLILLIGLFPCLLTPSRV